MAASDTELFFDLTNSVFVQSVSAFNQIQNPVFVADDTKPILLKLLRKVSPTEVEVIDLTGIQVTMGIGMVAATPTVYTSATSGAVDSNGFLPISLPFNLVAIQTALGTAKEVLATVEFRVLFGANPQRFQCACTIKQRLLTGTVQDPEAPAVATTLAEVRALMVPRDGSDPSYPCYSFIMLDEETDLPVRAVMRGGQFHFEPIS